MNTNHIMNVLYCIDETKKDYSRFLWVSILSLLENNKNENICIYIITTKLEEENKKELERIVSLQSNKTIKFSTNKEIIPKDIKDILYKGNFWPISCYYRLFFHNCFPEIKDRLLYLDCDTIINKNLSKFYNTDFWDNVIAWQFDIPITRYRIHEKVWMNVDSYINSWVLLFNVPKFIEYDLYKEINDTNKNYSIMEVDQDYINIIFKWKILLYNKLQAIITSKNCKDIKDFLVLHTIAKPNHPLSQCPNKIIKIFDTYLWKTKWKDFYKSREVSFYTIKEYVYRYVKNFIVYKSEKLFWVSTAWKIYNFYPTTYIKRIIQNLKNYFN